jgi:PAS domain S-box-containing protein
MEQARAERLGFTDYIFKPAEPSRIVQSVRAYLRPAAPPAQDPGRGRRILLAHDDPTLLKLLRVRLEQAGFQVITALDGKQAYEAAKLMRPDAIVSDVLMPRLDGFRLALAVRQDPELQHLPLVLISAAFTEPADHRLAGLVGANVLLNYSSEGREIIDALVANMDKAPPRVDHPVEFPEDYVHRLIRQLERQVTLNSSLHRRLTLCEAELAILAGLAGTLEPTTPVQAILEELLHRSLDAAGVSKGAVYFSAPGRQCEVPAHLGYAEADLPALQDFFGHASLLRRAMERREPIAVPSAAVPPEEAADLLEKSEAVSLVIAPLISSRECLGALLMASATRELGEDWIPFVRAIGGEIGQSVRLARTLSLLRENEEKLARILATLADGVILADRDGRITYANTAAEKILGLPEREITRRSCNDPAWKVKTLDGKPFRAAETPFAQVLATGQPVYGVEQVYTHSDGVGVILSVNAAPLHDAGGGMVGVVLSLRDITRRRQVEAAVARYNAELEQFAYVAAHDLQEPLRTVASFTQLLAIRYKGKLDSEADKFIELAVTGATRMRRLIDDLLTYSRVTRHQTSLQANSATAVFQQSLASLRAAVEESGAVISADPLPEVTADPTRLEQVFQNLLSNALKFRGVDPPRIHVAAEKKGREWVFSVRDNGIGIDPQYGDRVFKIFERLHGKNEYPGTGVGLALCKKIVEQHRGRIWVQSQPGEGAVFYFTLPAAERP